MYVNEASSFFQQAHAMEIFCTSAENDRTAPTISLGAVSYTHLTLPTISLGVSCLAFPIFTPEKSTVFDSAAIGRRAAAVIKTMNAAVNNNTDLTRFMISSCYQHFTNKTVQYGH